MTAIPGLLERPAALSLRAGLGLLLALLLPRLDLATPWVAALFAAGWIAFVLARLLVLGEPGALRELARLPTPRPLHLGESVFVSLALLFLLLWLDGLGFIHIGITLGALIIVSYLVLHGAVLLVLTAWAAGRVPADAPPRPRRRAFIRTAAFLAEEIAVLAALTITEGQRADLVSGPWTLTDALWLPATGALVLFLCYAPIARLGAITSDPPPPIRDALVAHTLALFVLALTGSLPL